MEHIENYYNFKKFKIFYKIINVNNKCKKGVLFLHGKGGHSKYFENIIENNNSCYKFFTIDLPGFGLSSGRRGHIRSFSIYFNIVNSFIVDIIMKNNINELFIVGESVGSLISFFVGKKYNISILKGLIFMPGLFDIDDFHKIHNKLLIYFLNIFYPLMNLKGNKSIETYTNNITFQKKLNNDPLWERNKSIRFISEIYKYIKYINKEIVSFKHPILIFQGRGDVYNKGYATDDFYKKIPFSKKNRLVYLENSKHWLVIDNETDKIKNEMYKWIDSLYKN